MDVREVFGEIAARIVPEVARYRSRIQDLAIEVKSDKTLLTEADQSVQMSILRTIRRHDDSAFLIAEETHGLPVGRVDSRYCWIVDPIDGTREFVAPGSREFCTAICVLDDQVPVAALVLAHELGARGSALKIEAFHGSVMVNGNGVPDRRIRDSAVPRCLSLTRSSGTEPPDHESRAREAGCAIKIRTTSQTLDLVRTALDLSSWSDSAQDGFDLFYRPNQKIWDGAPGIFINLCAGRVATDFDGSSLVPFRLASLLLGGMTLPHCIVGRQEHVEWFRSLGHPA